MNPQVKSTMTKAERDELTRLIKARTRVAKASVDQRVAELIADVERQLAATYELSDRAWCDVTSSALEAVEAANAKIAKRCRALGVPKRFQPRLYASWSGRGENSFRDRRVELRRVAETRIEAAAQQARLAIEAGEVDLLTRLVAGALVSREAQAFLAAMPTVQELMPALDVKALVDGGSLPQGEMHDDIVP